MPEVIEPSAVIPFVGSRLRNSHDLDPVVLTDDGGCMLMGSRGDADRFVKNSRMFEETVGFLYSYLHSNDMSDERLEEIGEKLFLKLQRNFPSMVRKSRKN